MLKYQEDLTNQMQSYTNFLHDREGYKIGKATFFGLQMQDFQQNGLTPKEYFEEVNKTDSRAAEKFLMNFRQYVQFTQDQYFNDFHELRWKLGAKHVKGVK